MICCVVQYRVCWQLFLLRYRCNRLIKSSMSRLLYGPNLCVKGYQSLPFSLPSTSAWTGASSQWAQLPTDILSAVFLHLPQSDKSSARLVCRPWAQQILQDTSHISKRSEVTKQSALFLQTSLPSLNAITLMCQSLYRLHTLTQLTSIDIKHPSYVPDLMPLTDLPRLRKLRLEGCELARMPCFRQLTQLQVS